MDELEGQEPQAETKDEQSALFKALRADHDAAMAELKELKAEKADAVAAAQQQRKDTAAEIVNTLGVPNLAEDVLNWVEGEITRTSVVNALEAKGLKVEGTPAPATEPEEAPAEEPSASKLGQQVADAAQGAPAKELGNRIAEAQTPAELEAIMRESGGSVSYT
jgi:hypothetical protein